MSSFDMYSVWMILLAHTRYVLPYLTSKPIACFLSKILSLEMWYLWVCSAESPGHHLSFSIIVSFGKLYFPQLSYCVVLVGLTLVPISEMNSQSYGFSSSHVWMWELDSKEGWVPKNWCFQTVVLEKTLKSPSDCKEVEPVNPKGKLPWILIRRIDGEGEAPILWPPDVVTTGTDFNFLGSKITADSDCSNEIKRCLLLGKKVMTNLDSIFKSRDIILPTRST